MIEELFKISQGQHPELGSYIHLCIVISGTNTKRPQIIHFFDELMPEDEYDKPEKNELIDYLVLQSEIGEIHVLKNKDHLVIDQPNLT